MMSQWKKSVKLLKYGYQFKTNVACAVFFLLLGIFCLSMDDETINCSMGALYISLTSLILCQLLKGVMACGIAAASPERRSMEIQVQDVWDFVTGTISYVFVLAVVGIKSFAISGDVGALGDAALYAGMAIMVLTLYASAVYKKFWISLILFVAAWILVCSGLMGKLAGGLADTIGLTRELPLPAGLLLGLLLVWLGVVLSGLLRRALYKIPGSKFAMGAIMRKQV